MEKRVIGSVFSDCQPRLKQDMWSQIAEEMGIPWCAVEAIGAIPHRILPILAGTS
jgi:hypothetical protein